MEGRGQPVIALLLFCCPIASAGDRLESGRYLVSQTWSQEKDFQRPYYVNVPAGAAQDTLPVFIFLHGNGGRAEGAINGLMRQLKTIATRYVMVFPEGYSESWNIVSERSKADDRAFIEAIVKKLGSYDNVLDNDFTIMGNSNGAALVNQLAIECRLPQIRNYICTVSPLNVYQHDGRNFRSKGDDNSYREIAQPMSGKRLLNISGTEDRLVPYRGGPSPVIPAKDGKLAFVDAEESAFLWAKQMGYQGSKLSDPTLSNGKLEIFSYLNGDVVHVKVNGEGHGASRAVSEKILSDFLAGSSEKNNRSIVPASSLPESTPWDLAKLSEVPEFTWDAGEEIRSLYYSGEPFEGNPTRVFANYASPTTVSGKGAGDEKFPAIVLVHGGGGTAFPQWAKLWALRGYAAIAMDLAGCGPNRVRLADGGPGQGHDMKFQTIGKPVTEQWTYHAVANVIRAHSLIRSFPEVDSSRTAITGISWGGYLTCIVSGLDNRFQAAVPVYGCGFLHENSAWLGDFAKMSNEHRAKWVKLWDPSRYVGSARMPMLFVNGGKDFAYPPDSHAKTYGLVKSPKYLHFVPDLPHGHIFDRPSAIEHFIESQLNGGPPLAGISKPTIVNGKALATVYPARSLVEATLHFTTDGLSGDASKREWTSRPATINEKTIAANSPPDDATAWFLTVKDERDVVTSSPLVVRASDHPRNGISSFDPDQAQKKADYGFRTHQISSPYQAGKTRLRILLPDDFDHRRKYRVLYVLPVHEDGIDKHGDGLIEIKKHGFHNQHQLICVAPGYTSKPWFADHDLNPNKQDESHLLKTVIPFIEKRYPVRTDVRSRLLIGFSKSGWGAAALLLRNPNVFYRAAAWDSGIRVDTGPIEQAERAERIARDWGSLENFEANRLSTLIKTRGKELGDKARLFYFNTEGARAIGGVEIHRLLVRHKIPHRYVMEPRRKHAWDSGWIPEAMAFLVGEEIAAD